MRKCDLCIKLMYSKPRFNMNEKLLKQADREDLVEIKLS